MTRKASNKRTKAVLNVTPSDISPAAELIAANIDLLTEILLRQETLNFVSLHGRRHNLPSLSFLTGLGERFRTIEVAHSCNGLLLCYTNRMMSIDRHFAHNNIVYIVCNPTTKKYTLLPKRDGVVCDWSAYLVFDPSQSPRHYKVVLVGYSPGPYQIDVYSSQSSCWRKIISYQEIFGRGIFWNGAIHWLTCDDFLKRFDIDVEEIITMPNPLSPKILPQNKIMYFGECGGGLILIQSHSYCYCSGGLRILELKRDCSSWVVKCQVNLRALISAFPEMESRRNDYRLLGFEVLCAVEGESERGLVLLLAIPGRIVSYNPKKKTWDVLRDLVPRESEALDFNINYAVPLLKPFFQRMDEMEKVGHSENDFALPGFLPCSDTHMMEVGGWIICNGEENDGRSAVAVVDDDDNLPEVLISRWSRRGRTILGWKASNKRRKAVLNVIPSDISLAAELLATNLDLLTEILLRLPVLSTIRFKCVSKHWLSLLSDPQFAANHSTRNPRPSSISGLYFNIPQTLNFVSLHRHNLPSLSFLNGVREGFRTIMVAHSCNGLLLCYIRRMMSIDRHVVQYNISFIVCNPTTKKYTLLPIRDGVVIGWSAYLVFDPSKSPHHYKVVLVGSGHHRNEIDVYSSQSLCWRKAIACQRFFGRGVLGMEQSIG
ncbi:hypothetical protein RHSIM_Rhsim01G0014200 [Rhododendron simsii]|uniref:F-box domain-containing protein n=1 Tax=Rhododendron simsii TaxID=118357 RepID=A0A834LV29_RHOSS|nr:hypothetical protein RHSIM_Rhsim01G0014200 [Rhododendron simsii]